MQRMRRMIVVVALLSLAALPTLAKEADKPREVAVAYLNALVGKGNDNAREFLLGELTLTAEGFTIPNWKFKKRHKARVEEKSVAAASSAMRALDRAGAEALTKIMNLAEGEGGDEAMTQVTQDQANKMMAPTRKLSAQFQEEYPLFSYCARAGKDVYWNPENPWRSVLDDLGATGNYIIEFHQFDIFEKSGKKTRVWPLRVLRVKTKGFDSGWKILPASDWDPDF